MQATMTSSLVQRPLVVRSSKAQVSRQSRFVVKASSEETSTRRAALAVVFGAAFASALPAIAAPVNPAKESTGGPSHRLSSSFASSSGYEGTGTKKRGISAKEKAKILAEVRKNAGL